MLKKILSLSVIICFSLTTVAPYTQAHADPVLGLPAPGTMVNLSPAYEPVMIKGLTVHKDNPFLFDFIVDVGQDRMAGEPLKKEGEKLIRYFLASLAIPDRDVWVNLSPYEKNKMIPEALGQTDMGRDLLEQDYILKQITASLIYPEKQLGRDFWDNVYAKARQQYGTINIPVNTFNKVWIMADRAEVFEHGQTAFVTGQHLKVMLEEDYLALKKHSTALPGRNAAHSIGSDMVRKIILPELEKEVNTGKNFANLRQIFNSIILSSWYKKNLAEALLNQVYADKSRVRGIDLNDPTVKQRIYEQYLEAYKKGVFNYIKEEVNSASGQTLPRKYFSGGLEVGAASADRLRVITDEQEGDNAMAAQHFNGEVDFATLAVTQSIYPNNGKPSKSERAAISQLRRMNDLPEAGRIDITRLGKPAGQVFKARVRDLQVQELAADHAMAAGEEVLLSPKTVFTFSTQLWSYDVNGSSATVLSDGRYIAQAMPGKVGEISIDGLKVSVRNNGQVYVQNNTGESVNYQAKDAAMSASLVDPVESAFIEAEFILNQLMFPDLPLIPNFDKVDGRDQVIFLLRRVVRSGAAVVLANLLDQEGTDLQDRKVRDQIRYLLSVQREKIFSNGEYRNAEDFNRDMDALRKANALLRQAAAINNPRDRQAIVSLAIDELNTIDNPPAYSLREFLKAQSTLTRLWPRINGFLNNVGEYLRVHDAAMLTELAPGQEIQVGFDKIATVKLNSFETFDVNGSSAVVLSRGQYRVGQATPSSDVLIDGLMITVKGGGRVYVKNRTAATASFQERDAAMTATRSAVYSYDELLRSWQHNDFEEAPKIFSITTTGSSAPIMVHVTSVGEAWINGSQISREGVSRPGLIISRDEFMSAQTVDAAMLRPNLRGSFKGDREEKTNPIPRIRRIRNDNNWTTPLWKRTKGPGGIDLNTADGMQWNISKDGRGVEINIDPALIERVRRQGIDSLSPFILKMTPVSISSFY